MSRDGQQKALGLEAAKSFGVYETGSMPLAVGDLILATSNNDRANVRTGDRVHVKAIDGKCLTLENGKKLDVTEGIHFRQGYTVTAFACQGSQEISVLPFFPASVSHMIDQRSWHVVISRAVDSLRIYTNCPELVEQRAITPQNQLSALEFLNPPLSTAHTQDRELARESFELAKQIPELRLRRLARGDLMRLETASRAALEQAQSMEGGLEIER